jgi:hypothetical protein
MIEMKNKFIVIGFDKSSEIDDYKEGCLPDSGNNFSDRTTVIKGESIAQVLYKIKEFLGLTDDEWKDNFELNACDEDGRVDVQILEDENGVTADFRDIFLWKKGRKTLWSATYTFHIYGLQELKINEQVLTKEVYGYKE